MLDYLVLYQSESGNTKKIAATIFAHLPGTSKDLIDIHTDKHIPEAKIYFIGFCVHRGTCSMEISDFLSGLSQKQIALFATCGMGNSPDYYHTIEKNVSAWIENDNRYLGAFLCQGKMPQAVRQRYENLLKERPGDTQLQASLENFDRALSHPDGEDLRKAGEWAKRMVSLA